MLLPRSSLSSPSFILLNTLIFLLIQIPSIYSQCPGTEFQYPDGSCDLQCSSPFTQSITSGIKYCTPPCSSTQFYTWAKKCANSCPKPFVQQIDSQIKYCFLPCKDPLLYYYPATKACTSYCEATTKIVDNTYLTCSGDKSYSLLANLFLMPPKKQRGTSFVSMNILMEYTRYLDVSWPDRLENFVQSQARNILTIRGGLGMSESIKDKLPMGDMPTLWLKRGLHSSFLVNFWSDLMLLLILFGVAWIFWGLEKLRIRYNWTSMTRSQPYIDRIRVLCVYNLIVMIFAVDLGDIIFYTAVECTAPRFLAWGFFSFLALMITLGISLYYLIKIYMLIRGLELSQIEESEGIFNGKNFYVASNQVIHNGFHLNKTRLNKYFYLIYVCRAAMPMLLASWFMSNPMIQSVLQMFFSLAVMCYIIYMKPFRKMLNFVQLVIIEVLVFIANLAVVVLVAMELHGVKNTLSHVLFGDTVIICNTLINIVIITFFVLKLLDYYKQVRQFKKQSPKGWKLALVYFLVIPLQQGAFGFEELLEDIDTSNEIRKSMALKALALSQSNVSIFQKTKKSDLNTDHITILNMGDQSTRRQLNQREEIELVEHSIENSRRYPHESPLLDGSPDLYRQNVMTENYTINEKSLTPDSIQQEPEIRIIDHQDERDLTSEYIEAEARRRAIQENAQAYETREARRREEEAEVRYINHDGQQEFESRPVTRDDELQQSYSVKKVRFKGVGPDVEPEESPIGTRKVVELTKDEIRQRRRMAMRVVLPLKSEFEELDQEDYQTDSKFQRERLSSPMPGQRTQTFIDDPFYKGKTPDEYEMDIKPPSSSKKISSASNKSILRSTGRIQDKTLVTDSFTGSDPYNYGPTEAELEELRRQRKDREEEEELARLRKAQEEDRLRRIKDEELAKVRKAEEERRRRKEEEEELARLRKAEEDDKIRRAKEEELARLRKIEEEKARLQREKEEAERRARQEEVDRLKRAEEERRRKQQEKEEEDRRLRQEELARLKREEEERLRREREKLEQEDRARQAEIERLKRAEEERLRRAQEKEEEDRIARQEELARLRKAEEERMIRRKEEEELERLRRADEEAKRQLIAESGKRILLTHSDADSLFDNTRTIFNPPQDKRPGISLAKMESDFENLRGSNVSSILSPFQEPQRGRDKQDIEVVNASRQTSARHRSHLSMERPRMELPKEETRVFDDGEWELNATRKSMGRSRSVAKKDTNSKKPPVFYTVAKPDKLKKGKSFKQGENLETALQDMLDDVNLDS